MENIRTAEYVSAGHPDKICDGISDAILEHYLVQDSDSRVAVECMGGHGKLYIMGEVTSRSKVDVEKVAQKTYRDLGYKDKLEIIVNIVKQSPEIAQKVDSGGAGDQGIMIGYACDENEEYLPQEYYLAKKIIEELPKGFGPDAKSQVTIIGDKVDTIVLSAQTKQEGEYEMIVKKGKLSDYLNKYKSRRVEVNLFTVGGFEADTGLTGRKIVVDAYGPRVPVGGGAFSGKDYTKVDVSGAKMARKVAVEILKERKAKEVQVSLAYTIGWNEPVMAVAQIDGQQEDLSKYKFNMEDLKGGGHYHWYLLRKNREGKSRRLNKE